MSWRDVVEENERIVYEELGLPFIKDKMKALGKAYYDTNLPWYYHLFVSFSKLKEDARVLEIGTARAEFTTWCAQLWPKGHIETIDVVQMEGTEVLPDLDNVNYRVPFDSSRLLEEYPHKSFDFILIDGWHENPQVSIDIFQCQYLLKDGGYAVLDDVVEDDHADQLIKWERKTDHNSWTRKSTLEHFERKGDFEITYMARKLNKQDPPWAKQIAVLRKV